MISTRSTVSVPNRPFIDQGKMYILVVLLASSLIFPSTPTPTFFTRDVRCLSYLFTVELCTLPVVLERSQKDDLCGGVLDLKSYFWMNKVCEDCFSLYRDTDIYSACR